MTMSFDKTVDTPHRHTHEKEKRTERKTTFVPIFSRITFFFAFFRFVGSFSRTVVTQ